MELQAWLVGLADELKNNNQNEAAKVVEEMVGNDPNEQGGIAATVARYGAQNPLSGSVSLKVKVDGVEHDVALGGSNIAQGIVVGAILTAFLANGS